MKDKDCQQMIWNVRAQMLDDIDRFRLTVSTELQKMREQINRVSSSLRTDVVEFQRHQAKLDSQNSCAAKGHRITLKQVWDEPDTVLECQFRCANCKVEYVKREDQLNTKEGALLDAFNMKDASQRLHSECP